MRASLFACFIAAFCLVSGPVVADSIDGFRDAQRIIVITDNEAIHYASFCAFYEIRELLSEGLKDASESISVPGVAKYEVRALARSGEYTARIGDHWIQTKEGTALLSTARYERILALIEPRLGKGAPKAKTGKAVRQILARIQDPAYVEENLCSKH